MTSYQQRYKRSAAILNEKYCIYYDTGAAFRRGSIPERICGQPDRRAAFERGGLRHRQSRHADRVHGLHGLYGHGSGRVAFVRGVPRQEGEGTGGHIFYRLHAPVACRDGIPALTSVFKYFKKRTPSGAIIYSGNESINEPTDEEKALIDYALKAVCALGITDGQVHGEYMVDKNGPVLIEANCRVMGSSAPSGFLDKVFGYHETEVILNSMLGKEYHRRFRERPYKPLRKGYAKDFSNHTRDRAHPEQGPRGPDFAYHGLVQERRTGREPGARGAAGRRPL